MARSTKLIHLRNINLKKRYHVLCEKHKEWRNEAVIRKVAEEFYLSKRTVSAILNEEAAYRQIDEDQLLLFAP